MALIDQESGFENNEQFQQAFQELRRVIHKQHALIRSIILSPFVLCSAPAIAANVAAWNGNLRPEIAGAATAVSLLIGSMRLGWVWMDFSTLQGHRTYYMRRVAACIQNCGGAAIFKARLLEAGIDTDEVDQINSSNNLASFNHFEEP